MPTYEYQCGKCGFEFEREQRITEDPIKTCPECRSRKVKRLLSASGFILKGGGWYADGYGSSKPASAAKSGDSASDSGGGSSSSESSGSSGPSDAGGSGQSAKSTKSKQSAA